MKYPGAILITGASSGIGAALAQVYAAPGIFLSICGRNFNSLEAIAHGCRKKEAEVEIRVLDVRDREAMRRWIEETDNRHPLDLVISNAGVSIATTESHDSEEQDLELIDINLLGMLNTIHPIIPRMRARHSGQIALMSSLGAFRGVPWSQAYCASKAAVKIYGEGLRGSLKSYGIEVSVICPGFVKTRMVAGRKGLMPLILEADQAAKIIRRGLLRNKPLIAFPWPVYLIFWLLGIIPSGWTDFLISRSLQRR